MLKLPTATQIDRLLQAICGLVPEPKPALDGFDRLVLGIVAADRVARVAGAVTSLARARTRPLSVLASLPALAALVRSNALAAARVSR